MGEAAEEAKAAKSSKLSNPYLQLAWAMMKTGVIGYGGGPSVIPLIRYEAVTHYKWLEDEEFGEILALANALPGPIATKMAAYLGYRRKGALGAVVSVLAHIVPSGIAMIALLSAVQWLSGSAIVQGMIGAVIPVIAVMLGVMAYEFGERAVKGLGIYVGVAFFALAFGLLQLAHIHPAIVIVVFLGYGAFHLRTSAAWKKRKEERMLKREQEARNRQQENGGVTRGMD
ncbi:chromate transporter [Paenibacillus sp. LHD-117]|uniref:chromate transporter n=1 Tax=Paenibacillus sp. LHD-117 TaxID=3071412 RepID=UPI0027DFECF7|nr:chromate transporter [Paenibacillus sp. LHD-117]MDQ6418815.1 chromate transporter [Paenibacillus sp. LHD-117]